MFRVAFLIVALVGAFALLWQAGEAHYQSCLQRAAVVSPAHLANNPVIDLGSGRSQPVAVGLGPAPAAKVAGCSRLPW